MDPFETMQRAISGEVNILPDDFLDQVSAGNYDHLVKRRGATYRDALFLTIDVYEGGGYYVHFESPEIEGDSFLIASSDPDERLTLAQCRDVASSVEAMLYLDGFDEVTKYEYLEFRDPLRGLGGDIRSIRESRRARVDDRKEKDNEKYKEMALVVIAQASQAQSPAQLYRHWDKAGLLLYVGIACNHVNRLSQHRADSAWFPLIENITIEHFESRQAALNAERIAIVKERPIFNRQHSLLRLVA